MKVLIVLIIILAVLFFINRIAVWNFDCKYKIYGSLIDISEPSQLNHDRIKYVIDLLKPLNQNQEAQKRHLYARFRMKFGDYQP